MRRIFGGLIRRIFGGLIRAGDLIYYANNFMDLSNAKPKNCFFDELIQIIVEREALRYQWLY